MRVAHAERGEVEVEQAEEGVIRIFKPAIGSNWIVGVVGALQLDVLSTRMEAEYSLKLGFEMRVEADDRVVADGWGTLVGYDYAAGATQPIPDALRERIEPSLVG